MFPVTPLGAWANDNTVGMIIGFVMAAGPTQTAPSANNWLAGVYVSAPGQINAVQATTDVFRITGVVVLPGIEAPFAARSALIMRPYDQELLTCERYWGKISGSYRMTTTASGIFVLTLPFKVVKRGQPTMTFLANGATVSNSTFAAFTTAVDQYSSPIQFNGTANAESYNYGFTVSSDARL